MVWVPLSLVFLQNPAFSYSQVDGINTKVENNIRPEIRLFVLMHVKLVQT